MCWRMCWARHFAHLMCALLHVCCGVKGCAACLQVGQHTLYAHLVCNMITTEVIQGYKCMPFCSASVANYQATKLQPLSTKLCSSQLMVVSYIHTTYALLKGPFGSPFVALPQCQSETHMTCFKCSKGYQHIITLRDTLHTYTPSKGNQKHPHPQTPCRAIACIHTVINELC
jgi:hypothetical protein